MAWRKACHRPGALHESAHDKTGIPLEHLTLADPLVFIGLMLTGLVAGTINAVAGGGPILTLGGLALMGIDPRIASLTSTIALSPGQILAGVMASTRLSETGLLPGRMVFAIGCAIIGGAAGAALLLATSADGFRTLVPWLVLFATIVYALSGGRSFRRTRQRVPKPVFFAILLMLGIYGGYYGGGNSFLVLALLAFSGVADKQGALVKNIYVAAINGGAVVVFMFSALMQWPLVVPLAIGGMLGSAAGIRVVDWIKPALLRPMIILAGLALTGWLLR